MINTEPKPVSCETLCHTADMLRVLGHPVRLQVMELLGDGELDVSSLVARLGLAENTVSQHLNLMKAHGILNCRREGRHVFYRIDGSCPVGCIAALLHQ